MKHNLNKSYLLGLSLLSALLVIWLVNVSLWLEIKRGPMDIEHKARLHSLYLWNGTELTWAWMRVFSWGKNLNVLNWFMVWGWNASGSLVVIWWWSGNNLDWKNSGIGWWLSNTITSDDSAIGWWNSNTVYWSGGTVAWWYNNRAWEKGTVAWWYSNIAQNWWVVLWWQSNSSNWNGNLVFWKNAVGVDGSFSWNWNGSSKSAYILTDWLWIWNSGLISTLPDKVPLYVDWSVKIANSSLASEEWEIRLEGGCIRWYDGRSFRTFGRASWSEAPCGWADGICEFGWVLVQSGDAVTAYKATYSNNCNSVKKTGIVCKGWTLDLGEFIYPYCYNVTTWSTYKWSF